MNRQDKNKKSPSDWVSAVVELLQRPKKSTASSAKENMQSEPGKTQPQKAAADNTAKKNMKGMFEVSCIEREKVQDGKTLHRLFHVTEYDSEDRMVGEEIDVWCSNDTGKPVYYLEQRLFNGGNMWGNRSLGIKEITREELCSLTERYSVPVPEIAPVSKKVEEAHKAEETRRAEEASRAKEAHEERVVKFGKPPFSFDTERIISNRRSDRSDRIDPKAYEWSALSLAYDHAKDYYLVKRSGIVHILNTVGRYDGYAKLPSNMIGKGDQELIEWWRKQNITPDMWV